MQERPEDRIIAVLDTGDIEQMLAANDAGHKRETPSHRSMSGSFPGSGRESLYKFEPTVAPTVEPRRQDEKISMVPDFAKRQDEKISVVPDFARRQDEKISVVPDFAPAVSQTSGSSIGHQSRVSDIQGLVTPHSPEIRQGASVEEGIAELELTFRGKNWKNKQENLSQSTRDSQDRADSRNQADSRNHADSRNRADSPVGPFKEMQYESSKSSESVRQPNSNLPNGVYNRSFDSVKNGARSNASLTQQSDSRHQNGHRGSVSQSATPTVGSQSPDSQAYVDTRKMNPAVISPRNGTPHANSVTWNQAENKQQPNIVPYKPHYGPFHEQKNVQEPPMTPRSWQPSLPNSRPRSPSPMRERTANQQNQYAIPHQMTNGSQLTKDSRGEARKGPSPFAKVREQPWPNALSGQPIHNPKRNTSWPAILFWCW